MSKTEKFPVTETTSYNPVHPMVLKIRYMLRHGNEEGGEFLPDIWRRKRSWNKRGRVSMSDYFSI